MVYVQITHMDVSFIYLALSWSFSILTLHMIVLRVTYKLLVEGIRSLIQIYLNASLFLSSGTEKYMAMKNRMLCEKLLCLVNLWVGRFWWWPQASHCHILVYQWTHSFYYLLSINFIYFKDLEETFILEMGMAPSQWKDRHSSSIDNSQVTEIKVLERKEYGFLRVSAEEQKGEWVNEGDVFHGMLVTLSETVKGSWEWKRGLKHEVYGKVKGEHEVTQTTIPTQRGIPRVCKGQKK